LPVQNLVSEGESTVIPASKPLAVSPCDLRVTIKVKRHFDGFHAQIGDEPRIWGYGKNLYEAIGSVISNHPEYSGIEIDFKE
jgi:hypothetical protein